MRISRKRIISVIKLVIISYCLIGILLYYFQDKFLLHPQKLDTNHKFSFSLPFEEMSLAMSKDDTINIVRFLAENSMKRGIVVYFHGNRRNIEHYAPFTSVFTKKGYEVWMPDYPGFGKSRGTFEEKKIYSMAYQVVALARNRFSADSILIYGKSLGTGAAAYVASSISPRLLILETPYYDIPTVFRTYAFIYPVRAMANYEFPVWKFLRDVDSRIVIFQGTDDRITSYKNARKLVPYLKKQDRFITINGGSHNNLNTFKDYRSALDSLL